MFTENNNLPPHTEATLKNYFIRGWEPGGFVSSMLAMDMERALYTADVVNRHHLYDIGSWILEFAPPYSWGNYELIEDWCKDKDGRRTKFADQVSKDEMWNILKDTA